MPRTILVIDDEFRLLTAWKLRLEASGYSAITANDGQAGLNKAAKARPDLILLDIRMPRMDGFEACRQLKANADTAAIPVVFMSANFEDNARRQAAEVGAAEFLKKPLDANVVLATIAATIKTNQNTHV